MNNLRKVQWLTLEEVAALWAPQLAMPSSTVLRELRLAFYKIEASHDLKTPLKELPDESELPSPEALIDRDFIERFCDKEAWLLPGFWFEELATDIGPSFAGRPSVMNAIVQELQAVAERGELAPTLAAQCRVLEARAREHFPAEVQTPKAKAIENGVRISFWSLKKDEPRDYSGD